MGLRASQDDANTERQLCDVCGLIVDAVPMSRPSDLWDQSGSSLLNIGDLRCPMSSIRWEDNFDDTQAVWKSLIKGKGGSKPLANQDPGGVRKSHRSLQELNAI